MLIVLNGLIYGGMFALLAVGFALIFGVAKMVNLAHTGFYMVAAFVILIGTQMLALSVALSSVLAILASAVLGVACYKWLLDRVRVHEITVMILTVALVLLFQEVFLIIFRGYFRGIDPLISGYVELMSFRISWGYVIAIVSSLAIVLGVWVMLTKTGLGITIRAVAEDREIANVVGINEGQVCLITMAISAALAGFAAVVVAPLLAVSPTMWSGPLVVMIAAVILGGLGSIGGSIIGAYILGFTMSVVVFLVPGGSFLKEPVALVIMILILLVRPEGLFGKIFEEERL